MQSLFSGKLSWKEEVKNPARNTAISDAIRAQDDLMAELIDANKLDMELFQYMKQLKTPPFPAPVETPSGTALFNTPLNFLDRNLVYRPMKKFGK